MKKFIAIPAFLTVFLLSFTTHAGPVRHCIVAAGGAIAAGDTLLLTAYGYTFTIAASFGPPFFWWS